MLNVKAISYLALSVALLLLFTFTPFLGYIQISVISITLVPCVVMIISIIWIKILKWNPFIVGVISGLLLGLSSFLASFVMGGPLAVVFQNPLFSIVPRLLVGIVSGIILQFLVLRSKFRYWLTIIIWSFFVISTNSLATLAMIYFLGDAFFPDLNVLQYISWLALATNYLPELMITTLIILPIVKVINKIG